jgi:hypothetical protein
MSTMRDRLRVLVLVALSVVLVACGGAGTTTSETSTGRQSSGGQTAMSIAPSQARLLTVSDLGTGWQPGAAINASDLAAFAQLPCEQSSLEPAVAKRLTAVTGVQFDPSDSSYKQLIELVVTGAPSQLDRDLRSLFDGIAACSGEAASSAKVMKVIVKSLSIPPLGDQRAAYSITQSGSSSAATTLCVRVGYVRLGSVAVALGLADFQATARGGSLLSDGTYVQFLKTAVAKLGG